MVAPVNISSLIDSNKKSKNPLEMSTIVTKKDLIRERSMTAGKTRRINVG